MKTEETESVVQIDEHALDRECIRLPSNYLQAATNAAEARRDVAEAKAELELREAELANKIRSSPGDYGIEKITESAIGNVLITSEKLKGLRASLRNAQHQQELHSAVVSALEHKKRALTLLVELHALSYNSAPKVSPKGREAVQDMTKRGNRKFRFDESTTEDND